MRIASSAKYSVAALIGVAYAWLARAFWGQYVEVNLVNEWLDG